MNLNWYALQVRPRHEKSVAAALNYKALETYLPMYRSTRKWADRKKEIELPLFSGYVFCRFDSPQKVSLLNTIGVLTIVGIGRTPAPIEESEIRNLRRLEATELNREPCPYPSAGEEVIVCQGPLKGVTGTFVKVNRQSRLLLSVKLLHRAVSIEVHEDWVVPVRASQGPSARQTATVVQTNHNEESACY